VTDPRSRKGAAGKPCHAKGLTQNALYPYKYMVFNLWNGVPEHRPLDSGNRIRLAVYPCLAAGTAETEDGGS